MSKAFRLRYLKNKKELSYSDIRKEMKGNERNLEDLPEKMGMRKPYLQDKRDFYYSSGKPNKILRFLEKEANKQSKWEDVYKKLLSMAKTKAQKQLIKDFDFTCYIHFHEHEKLYSWMKYVVSKDGRLRKI